VKTPSIKQKLSLLLKHVQLFENTWESSKNYNILKRFFKIYVHGFDGAAALRAQLMETKTATEAISITSGYLKNSDFQE
jgi:tRNA-dihydrouridine synthase